MKTALRCFCFLLVIQPLLGQPYSGQKHTRHRFAQLTLGTGTRYTALHKLAPFVQKDGALEQVFHIGGTHFWGHSEFYVEIPVWSDKMFSKGVETGAKLYPWALTEKKLRPFASAAFAVSEFRIDQGATRNDLRCPLGVGLIYMHSGWMLDASYTWAGKETFSYYVSRQELRDFALPNHTFSIGLRKMLETTLSAERSWANGTTAQVTEKLAKEKRLDGLTLAAGVSSTWFLKPSGYNQEKHPFVEDQISMAAFADLGIGYYFHKNDWQTNVAYRRYALHNEAFDFEQRVSRFSLGLEAYKFLGDYHGFVPYLGGIVSYERLGYQDRLTEQQQVGVNGGITFGWDIRPNRLGAFLLRTNLRYYPKLSLQMEGTSLFDLSQIEFNFIQLVLFPQRFMGYR